MRILVFPYSYDCEPITRYSELLQPCYEIVAIVSPGGWGLAGKSIMLQNGKRKTQIYETIEEVTEEFDSLFIPDFGEIDEEVENRLVNEIINAISKLTHVIYAARFTGNNEEKLKESCLRKNYFCDFIDFSEKKELIAYGLTENHIKYPTIKTIDIPVVCVVGWWEKTDKFEVSLMLRAKFQHAGYRVSQIGSRNGCEMFGFHSFPSFMFSKHIDGVDKIIYFNSWIYDLVRKEQSDLLLITVPGAMQNFNNELTRGFGLLHHQIFQSVIPDVLVMCTLYLSGGTQAPKVLEDISLSCKYKFGAEVDVFHMSNLIINSRDSEERGYVVTSSIYRESVSKSIAENFRNISIPVFNALEWNDCNSMFEELLEKMIPKDSRIV